MNGLSRGAVFSSVTSLYYYRSRDLYLFIMDIALVPTAGPTSTLQFSLMYSQRIVSLATKRTCQRRQEAANGEEAHQPWEIRSLQILKCGGKHFGTLQAPGSHFSSVLAFQATFVALYVKINPFVGDLANLFTNFLTETSRSHPYLVLISALSLAYLSTVLVFSIPLPRGGLSTLEQRNLEIAMQVYVFT